LYLSHALLGYDKLFRGIISIQIHS
jgi:hypothetical protein